MSRVFICVRIILLSALGSAGIVGPFIPEWNSRRLEQNAERRLEALSPESIIQSCGVPITVSHETISGGGESAKFETLVYHDWSITFSDAWPQGFHFEWASRNGVIIQGGSRQTLRVIECVRGRK